MYLVFGDGGKIVTYRFLSSPGSASRPCKRSCLPETCSGVRYAEEVANQGKKKPNELGLKKVAHGSDKIIAVYKKSILHRKWLFPWIPLQPNLPRFYNARR
jgi:hypothetical protein